MIGNGQANHNYWRRDNWAEHCLLLGKKPKIKDILIIDRNDPMSLTSSASGENYRNWWPQIKMFALMIRSTDLMEDIARATKNRINMTRRGYALSTRRIHYGGWYNMTNENSPLIGRCNLMGLL